MPAGKTGAKPTAPRIYLHPGFHKTGTSSIQHFLWLNRDALAPAADILLLRHLQPVTRVCHAFSRTQNPGLLLDLAEALEDALSDVELSPSRTLILSCEALCGHLPGWPGTDSYGAAPVLLHYICGFLKHRFPDADITTILTTRTAEDWLFSAYRHHLKGQRLTLDRAAFSRKYRKASDLTGMANDIAKALAPLPVETLALEQATLHPLGPGGAFVQGMGLPADIVARLTPVGIGNSGPDDALWQRYLQLNRSQKTDEDVTATKTRLAQQAKAGKGTGGWTPAQKPDPSKAPENDG